jgi:predicted MFS family arabinose efflux permease
VPTDDHLTSDNRVTTADPDRTRRRAVAAMTFATGVVIANNYYAQPLEAAIAEAFDAPSSAVGSVLTLIQLSYALGLATLVPLGDLLERRRLTVGMLSVVVLGQLVVAVAPGLAVLAAAAAVVGLTTVAAQVLVPFAAHLAPEGEQGRVVSTVMSGLLIGVLISRVVAGLVSELVGWRAVFVLGALLTAVAVVLLWRTLPVLPPTARMSYPALLRSVLVLVREEPVLRWRMVYSASCYAAFGAVWTSMGFLLAGPPFRLSDALIGLFSLFGVAGAVGARFAGRLADRGRAHAAVGAFLALTALSFVALGLGTTSLLALAVGLIVFDLGVQGVHISNQAIVYALRPAARSRLNSAYMTVYFLGGATGSGGSALLYASHGWIGVCVAGAAFPTAGLLLWLVDTARRRARAVDATG